MSTDIFMVALLITVGLPLAVTVCENAGQVLMSIYHSTNGEHWLNKGCWNSSACLQNQENICSYCFWYGITCDLNSNEVMGIHLVDNNLTGSLPNTLWKLPFLDTLDLSSNENLGGKLEDFIFRNMTKMRILDLSFCRFEGALPEELTMLTNLAKLKLRGQRGQTKLNGSIPRGIVNLTNLQVLELGENNLTAPSSKQVFGALRKLQFLDLENVPLTGWTFEVFCNLADLKSLNLSKTGISGDLPANLGKRFSNMEELLLPGNNLNGCIPHSIGSMKNLNRLSLANNQLSGAIPSNITRASKLSFIDLSENDFSSIDNESFLLSGDVEILLLSSNTNLNVSLERFLNSNKSGPAKLKVLDIEKCRFYGKIPKSIWSFSNLIYVNVANNFLSGSLPEVLAPMYSLLQLDVSYNHLEGRIPSTLSRIESLHSLDIRGNHNMSACREHEFDHCNTSMLQHGLKISFSYMRHSVNGSYSCPIMATLQVTNGPVYLDPRYYGHTFCQCEKGYYGKGNACMRCMEGGKCDGRGKHMIMRKGFWPEPKSDNVTALTACAEKADFFSSRSRDSTACNPTGECSCHLVITSKITECNQTCLCSEGSSRRLCSYCKKRWYRSGGICLKCPPHHHATYLFIGVLFVTLVVFIMALLILRNRPRLSLLVIYGQISILFFLRCFNIIPGWVFEINLIILLFYLAGMGSSTKGLQKIAIFYVQILDAMLSTYNLWPEQILKSQDYISSVINFHFPGLMCDIPDMYTPAGQYVSLIILPVVCISITWLFYCVVWIARHRITSLGWNILSIKHHCLQITVTCLNLTYFPIGLRSIAVLASCRDHSSHMRIAPWIPCSSPSSSFLQALAWLSIVFYVVGVPFFVFLPLLLCYVRTNKRSELSKHEKEALDKWLGSIYLPYKEKCRSFCEVYALLRKLLLAFMIGYISEISSFQTFFVSVVLSAALTFHLVWQPYQRSLGWIPIENILETIVLVVLQHSFILLRFTTVEKPEVKRVELLWIIVGVNCLVVVFLVGIISVLIVKHAAKSFKNKRTCKSKNDFLSYVKSKNSLFKPLLTRENKDSAEDE